MRRAIVCVVALLMAACVSNPPAETPVPQPATAPAFDPVGNYDFTIELMGQTQTGEMRLMRQEGQLAGVLSAQGQNVDLRNVKVDARKVTATATGPQGGPEVQFTFNFEDNDKFTGTLMIPGMAEARVWGARKKPS